MKISGKNNQFDNQPINNSQTRKSDVNYEEKDIANSPNPAEYLGRSQVVFSGRGRGVNKGVNKGKSCDVQELEPVKLTETPILSEKDALKCLKDNGFTHEDIALFDLEDKETLSQISYFKGFIESGYVSDDELKGFKEEMKTTPSKEKREWMASFVDASKYINKENMKELSKYLKIEDSRDVFKLVEFIKESEDSKYFFDKLHLIASVNGKIDLYDDLRNYKYYGKEDYDRITPERINIINRINEYLPDDGKLHVAACQDLEAQEKDLTPEVIDKHCSLLEELSKVDMLDKATLKYSYAGDTIIGQSEKMEQVLKMLKEHPFSMDSTDTDKLALANFHTLAQKDGEEVQKYINSLTPDAKLKGIQKFVYDETGLPANKLAEICNIVYDKSYGKIYDDRLFAFIDENKGENCENIDGIIMLLNAYKGTDVLESYHPEYKLRVANKDFEGAAKAIRLKRELDDAGLNFNESMFYEVMYDKDADFGKFNQILQFMKDNSINYYDYPGKIYRDANGLNKLELRHHIKTRGTWLNDDQWKDVDKLADTIRNDDEKAFVKEHLFQKDQNNNTMFYVEDVELLLAAYREKPELITEILNERKPDGDFKYKRVADSIIPISEARAIDKDYTNFLMDMKEYRGRTRFGHRNLKKVVEAHNINPEFTNRLLAEITTTDDYGCPHYRVDEKILEKLKNNEQPEVIKDEERMSFRHSADNIRELVDIHAIDPEFTEFLLDNYNNVRTDVGDIRTIVEAAQNDKELVKTLLAETTSQWDGTKVNRFAPGTIKEILDNLPEDKQFIYDIISEKKVDFYNNDRMVPVYESNDIVNLCKAACTDLELTKDLMSRTLKSGKIEYKRFSPSEIKDLVVRAQKDKVVFNDVLNQTKKKYDGEDIPRYEANDFYYIMMAVEADKQCALNLLKYNESCPDRNVYQANEIENIAKVHQNDPEYVDLLLSKKAVNYNNELIPLLNGGDITYIIDSHKKDPEYTDYLVDKYEKANGNDDVGYKGEDIAYIVGAHLEDKELTEELTEQTVRGEEGKLVHRFKGEQISSLVTEAKKDKEFIRFLVNDTTTRPDGKLSYTFTPREIDTLLYGLNTAMEKDPNAKEYVKILVANKGIRDNRSTTKFDVNEIVKIINNTTLEQYKDLESKVGDKIKGYNANDILTASEFEDLYQRKSINEIPIKLKKDLLRRLVRANVNLFGTSDVMHGDFPLVPNNQEEYCKVLPALVHSLGIETNQLSEKQTENFNKTITNLSGTLAKLSDAEYNNIMISQEYSKDDFIKDVLAKVKDLEPSERQKVYDYFGFELHKNPKNYKTGFSIIGYPVNLNNGKKLAEITDENTKKVVEALRSDVIKFSENNKITCNNKEIEKELNEIASVLPEIRTMIGKNQHKAHDFDVFKHSLKVMQKVAQDENFDKLNKSDKKIMLLASLMHDITKVEGTSDGTHPMESAYDTFFITKKFNLTKDEEIKLYTLIRHHEWLSHVNTAKSEEERKKAQQSVAFDLQQNNLFDMAMMFTHADLKSVKNSDLFHDKTEGDSRIDFNGVRRSFGEAADFHAEKIREYIGELKKTQPLMPTTKMPKASDIEKLITTVNPDGSTNIKGVYVKEGDDGKRLVILKFNEVTDEGWERMGLPKGSSTKGTIAHCSDGSNEYDVETGNIKFFVHGLDYPNQLAKFDAFSLLNSDALLSVSYAERPETKFRFFRAQGVMLEDSADYVYGGGNTDSGSGCGKDIDEFKKNYIFGGYRERDRKYIPDLVKEATGMSDEEYVEFYEKNKNKAMAEIEPKETRDKIIKAFATINSNTRKGDRNYNEMYLSNPKSVMGVYAYSWNYDDSSIPDPVKFLEENDDRTHFLQDYAKEHDLPFVLFGD